MHGRSTLLFDLGLAPRLVELWYFHVLCMLLELLRLHAVHNYNIDLHL